MRTDINKAAVQEILAQLEQMFKSHDYEAIEEFSRGRRLSAGEIRSAIASYPEEVDGLSRRSLDIVKVENSERPRWSINVRFTTSNRESDLTLSLLVEETERMGLYSTEINDIHVL